MISSSEFSESDWRGSVVVENLQGIEVGLAPES
jgi:hypothetical protein